MAFFTTFTERADMTVRIIIAYAFMAVLFILNIIAISFPLTGAIKVPLFLMGIYYWAIYRPTLLPIWVVFLVGCVMDLLSGLPIGMNALVFVAAQWVISGQRRFLTGQSFMMIWIGFGLLSFVSAFIQWGIFGLTQLHWFSIDVFLASNLFGIALFPAVCIILHFTHKLLPTPHSVISVRAQS